MATISPELAFAIDIERQAEVMLDNARAIRRCLEDQDPPELQPPQIMPDQPEPPFGTGWRTIAHDNLFWCGDRKHERYSVRKDYLLHMIDKGSIVEPPKNWDSPFFPVDLDDVECVMLSGDVWANQFHSQPGKSWALSFGEGHYGRRQADGEAYHVTTANADVTGDQGATANLMHPTSGNRSGFRLLGTWHGMDHDFGYNIGDGETILPLKSWHRIQLVGYPAKGWQLWLNGKLEAEDFSRGRLFDSGRAKGVSVRKRDMYGGTSSKYPALWFTSERRRNAWILAR